MTGLLASRLGLVLHEFAGHGLPTLLFGGEVNGWDLTWFGGGSISLGGKPEGPGGVWRALAINLGGIVVEFCVGAAAILLSRRLRARPLAHVVLLGVGAALSVHGLWYLTVGLFDGFGDGSLLYWVLRRHGNVGVALGVSATGLVVVSGILGRDLAEATVQWTRPGPHLRRFVALVVAVSIAGACHGTLTSIEARVMYGPPADRPAGWFDPIDFGTRDVDEALEHVTREELGRKRFLFHWLSGIAIGMAAMVGGWRGVLKHRNPPDGPPPRPRLTSLTATLAALLSLIGILRLLAP